MISIICPSNKPDVLKNHLQESLAKQVFSDYELIVVDPAKLHFHSASEALNYGASLSHGDLLVFCHQDIEFLNPDGLSSIVTYAKNNDFGIAGVAGVGKEDHRVYASVIQGPKRKPAGIINDSVFPVVAVDECLMIIKRDLFMGFDDLGPTWHFYGVDYSYRCLKQKQPVLLFPIPIFHVSPGWSLDNSYFDTLRRVARKYPEEKEICTCVVNFPNGKKLEWAILKKKIKMGVKKILRLK